MLLQHGQFSLNNIKMKTVVKRVLKDFKKLSVSVLAFFETDTILANPFFDADIEIRI